MKIYIHTGLSRCGSSFMHGVFFSFLQNQKKIKIYELDEKDLILPFLNKKVETNETEIKELIKNNLNLKNDSREKVVITNESIAWLNWRCEDHKKDFLPWCLFNQLKDKALSNINDIYAQEAGLYSDKYKVAGRVDCIARYNGVLSIIDFKTSTRERSDDWNENYYIQGSAYAEMFEERTGTEISQIVILVVTEDGTVQEFIKQKYDYLDSLSSAVAEWRNQNEIPSLYNDDGVAVNG